MALILLNKILENADVIGVIRIQAPIAALPENGCIPGSLRTQNRMNDVPQV